MESETENIKDTESESEHINETESESEHIDESESDTDSDTDDTFEVLQSCFMLPMGMSFVRSEKDVKPGDKVVKMKDLMDGYEERQRKSNITEPSGNKSSDNNIVRNNENSKVDVDLRKVALCYNMLRL